MPKLEHKRGPITCVAGPLFVVTILVLEGASCSVEARAVDTMEIRPTAERRARLLRTFDEKPERQTASRATHNARSNYRPEPLLAMLIALALSAALARGASLRLSRVATRIR